MESSKGRHSANRNLAESQAIAFCLIRQQKQVQRGEKTRIQAYASTDPLSMTYTNTTTTTCYGNNRNTEDNVYGTVIMTKSLPERFSDDNVECSSGKNSELELFPEL